MIALTGASGHVGTNLLPMLLERGHDVRVLAFEGEDFTEIEGPEYQRGDVRDRASLDSAFEGAEAVIHLAAKISIVGDRDGSVWETNVTGARNVAEAALAANVKRLVHTSSCHAFNINDGAELVDETAGRPGPRYPAYDRSKAAGEAEVRKVIERGLDAVVVNPSGIIGPNDPEPSRMGRTLLNIASGRLPGLIDGGFDWVDVRDVCEGVLLALERGRTGENYLLSGHWLSVSDIAGLVEEFSGRKRPWFTSPMWLARMTAPIVHGLADLTGGEPLYTPEALHALRASPLCNGKAVGELGFSVRPTRDSVRDALASFREQGRL